MTDPDPPEIPQETQSQPPEDRPAKPADDAEAARLLEVGLSDTDRRGRVPPPSPAEMETHFPALEVFEILGQGGMGVVYKARQRKLDRLVALKVLPQELARDPAFAERFRREARTLARLQHLHIVGVHEFGEVDGFYYLIMEYVDGVTLRQLMATGELSTREALAIVPQICDALQYAHDAGVVHRDVKPENILLDRAGRVKVADFGLAKLMQPGETDFTLTGTDQVMGTLHYMAPEQYKTPQDVDHRADIFSLGVVFFEMLTGELPVGRFANPSEAPDLDERIDEIVLRALERERELRYQSAGDVKADVRTFVGDKAAQAPASAQGSAPRPEGQGGDVRKLSRWAHWSFWMIFLGVGAGLLVAGITYNRLDDGYHSRVGGLWTWFGAAGIVVVLATTGIVATRRRRTELRGLGLSIMTLLIGCVGMAAALVAIGGERRLHGTRLVWEKKLDPRPQLPHIPYIQVDGVSESWSKDNTRARIMEVWKTYLGFVAVQDLRPSDPMVGRFYDAADIEILRQLTPAQFESRRATHTLGMGFVGATSAETPSAYFRLQKIVVDEWGRTATVTARVVTPIRRDSILLYPVMTFPMKRVPGGWLFAIGKVEITE